MDPIEALRIIALRGAVKPDWASNERFVMRWYSKTFHTPLHMVYDLPLSDIWLTYFEELYKSADQEFLDEEVAKLFETPEQRAERERLENAEKVSEYEFAKMSEQAAAKNKANLENLAQKTKVIKDLIPKMEELADQFKVESLSETQPEPLNQPLEPDIEMEFVDPDEMEKILSGGMANKTK